MRKFFLIRHGNAYDQNWRQNAESSLNKTGEEHARALAERFKNYPVDEVYCSTMERAKDTCDVFLRFHQEITPQYEDSLRELVDQFFSSDEQKALFLKDGFSELKAQVRSTFESVVKNAVGENIFLFTHGHWIRFLVSALLNGNLEGFMRTNVDFASVSIVIVEDDGRMALDLFNDCSHTKGLPYGCSWC